MISITKSEFQKLSEYIKANYGINLKEEKITLLTGRLYTVLQNAGFESFGEYYEYLINDKSGIATVALVDKITTNHTFFMREADHFVYFRDQVLPYLKNNSKEKDLRVWCAACSSGEEAYTLAMLIDEYFGSEKVLWDTKVLATDISEKVLEIAKKGVYSDERIAPLPSGWKKNYFKSYEEDQGAVIERIRNEVIYRKFNLMDKTFPFRKKFHVIFCRNVMIYFDNNTKNDLLNKLYDSLEYGGYLFIGHSESLNKEMTKFQYIMPSIYRKN